MIDWYSGLLGYTGEALKLNRVCEIDPEGTLLWNSESRLQVKGSYDASIQLRRAAPTPAMSVAAKGLNLLCNPVVLEISGNPSKFLQGHNVFGPPVASLSPVMQAMVRAFPQGIRPADADSDLWPAVHRSRVDVTTSVDLGSHRLVHEWLRTAGTSTRSRHGPAQVEPGRSQVSGSTVYWGKHSTRWTLKAYCKFCELQKHPPKVPDVPELMGYCEGHLRIELTLRRPELEKRGTLDESLIWEFMNKLEVGVMKGNGDMADRQAKLGRSTRLTLSSWMAGEDVRFSLDRRTYYRHRREILDQLGLDIGLTYQKETAERDVYDLEYLKAHEIKIIPSSMQGLLFKPKPSPRWGTHQMLEPVVECSPLNADQK